VSDLLVQGLDEIGREGKKLIVKYFRDNLSIIVKICSSGSLISLENNNFHIHVAMSPVQTAFLY